MVLFQGLRRTESNLLSSEACTSASSISKKSWKVNSSFFHFALILDLILPLRSDCSSLTSSRKMTSTASHPPSTTQATLIPQISVMSTPYNTKTLTTTEATLIPAPLVPSAMSRDTQLASPASCSTGRSQVGKDLVTIAYRTTTAKPRFRQLSPRVAHPRTPKNGNARSFGLLAFRTPRLPRFTFCATAEIET